MNKNRILSIFSAGVAIFSSACSPQADMSEYGFANSGFERGTLSGWQADGEAFTEDCIVLSDKDSEGNRFFQEGDFFYYGYKAGGASTGTLTGEKFKLKGNGKIGFLIGAGADIDKCYVALCRARDGGELVRRANDEFSTDFANTMHRVILDGSAYAGTEVFIKIVDYDTETGGYNYLNVDDFIVNYQGAEDMTGKIFEAEKYIDSNISAVNTKYRLKYHAMPPVGWMNDPNGFSYAFGKTHLFYQFHPYSPAWGPMHWGHYTSSDFVKWDRQPVALAPDKDYDKDGCFSGSAVTKDGKMYLMYTSCSPGKQTQALAVSTDGVTFEKLGEVIGGAELPPDASRQDFRDPKAFERNGVFYSLIGSKNNDGSGQLLLYSSQDLTNWSFKGTVLKDKRTNDIYECPDFVTIGGTDVIITSPQGFKTDGWKHENVHGNLYMTGVLDANSASFQKTFEDEIDSGFDFYAPQTLTAPDGRVIMTAWMQMWDRTMPTQAHNWAGAMILPRELSIQNGKLIQKPVREIEKYRINEVVVKDKELSGELTVDGVGGTAVDLEFELETGDAEKAGVRVFCGEENYTEIYYDAASGLVVFDRSNMGTRISGAAKELNASQRYAKPSVTNGRIKFRLLLDTSSAEIFMNDGECAMTGNIYSESGDAGIVFFSEGGSSKIFNLAKYDLNV